MTLDLHLPHVFPDQVFHHISIGCEWLAFGAAVLLFFKNRTPDFAVLLLLLLQVVIVENYKQVPQIMENHFIATHKMTINNITLITEQLFYLGLLYFVMEGRIFKRMIVICMCSILVLFVIVSMKLQPINQQFSLITYCVSALTVIVFILRYFNEQIKLKLLKGFASTFWNWYFSFLFIAVCVEITFICSLNYMYTHPAYLEKIVGILCLKYISSSLYYLSFIFGSIWMKKK